MYPKIHSFLIIIGQKGMKNNLKMERNRAKQKLVVQFFFRSMAVEVTNAINLKSKKCSLFVRNGLHLPYIM